MNASCSVRVSSLITFAWMHFVSIITSVNVAHLIVRDCIILALIAAAITNEPPLLDTLVLVATTFVVVGMWAFPIVIGRCGLTSIVSL